MFGAGARLERSIIAWMLDLHTREHGYTELMLPTLVRREVMEGSGNLPKFGDNLYHDDEDDLWLVPTAEVPITSLYRDEILLPGTLPVYYVAQTPCFRREKAAAGRDTRGIKRVHQFNKVEMYRFAQPETSEEELEKLVADAEDVCQRLGLPYRVLKLCTGDLGFASAKSIRHRNMGARLPGMAGGQLLLQLHRFPGPSLPHPVSASPGGPPGVPSHVERLRLGLAPDCHIHPGKLPAGRRLSANSGSAAPLHRIRHHPRQPLTFRLPTSPPGRTR